MDARVPDWKAGGGVRIQVLDSGARLHRGRCFTGRGIQSGRRGGIQGIVNCFHSCVPCSCIWGVFVLNSHADPLEGQAGLN